MTELSVAVPRKGRPLEAVLERAAARSGDTDLADTVISTLQYEKALTKGNQTDDRGVYDRLAAYSDTGDGPEYTLLRDARDGFPRRIVFDSCTFSIDGADVQFVGREEPFRALRKHEFALGFDSADLVLEEVVELRPDPLSTLAEVNERIDPRDTDVRVVGGMGDTVYHTLLATPEVAEGPLDRSFIEEYEGEFCLSPRYERLVEAVLGTDAIEGVSFTYPDPGHDDDEEAAIAEAGVGAYLTVTGGTARDYGLAVGQRLFPSETVLLENSREMDARSRRVARALVESVDSAVPVDA